MTERGARPRASASVDGTAWELFDAWRATSGSGLGYFIRQDRDPGDLRVELAPDVSVADLDEDSFRELWSRGRSLTDTERRLIDEAGEVWLVQGVGPVWAEGGTAADATGVRLRCISRERPIVRLSGRAPGEIGEADLRAAISAEGSPADPSA